MEDRPDEMSVVENLRAHGLIIDGKDIQIPAESNVQHPPGALNNPKYVSEALHQVPVANRLYCKGPEDGIQGISGQLRPDQMG